MTDAGTPPGAAGMSEIREAVVRQLGTARPQADALDLDTLVRFSDDLPAELAPEERARLAARAEELQPWLQGPFLLGGDLVVGGVWRNDHRWAVLGEHVPSLEGMRVLDVGSNAGWDPFMFRRRGASYVLGCEPFEFIEQALFLESVYKTGADLRRIGWQQLTPEEHGTFDLVHCHGVLYHEPNPVGMLARLHEMTAPGGTLLMGSMMHADTELAELVRFVPRAYYGDETWWWVPGRLALRSLVASVGFDVVQAFAEHPGPPGEFPTLNGYVRAVRRA